MKYTDRGYRHDHHFHHILRRTNLWTTAHKRVDRNMSTPLPAPIVIPTRNGEERELEGIAGMWSPELGHASSLASPNVHMGLMLKAHQASPMPPAYDVTQQAMGDDDAQGVFSAIYDEQSELGSTSYGFVQQYAGAPSNNYAKIFSGLQSYTPMDQWQPTPGLLLGEEMFGMQDCSSSVVNNNDHHQRDGDGGCSPMSSSSGNSSLNLQLGSFNTLIACSTDTDEAASHADETTESYDTPPVLSKERRGSIISGKYSIWEDVKTAVQEEDVLDELRALHARKNKRKRKHSGEVDSAESVEQNNGGIGNQSKNNISARLYRKRRKLYVTRLEQKINDMEDSSVKRDAQLKKVFDEAKVSELNEFKSRAVVCGCGCVHVGTNQGVGGGGGNKRRRDSKGRWVKVPPEEASAAPEEGTEGGKPSEEDLSDATTTTATAPLTRGTHLDLPWCSEGFFCHHGCCL
jgi:hypothetical protein